MPETRWEQLKKYTFVLAVILLVALPIIAVSPAGPGAMRWYIDKYNPPGQAVEPWATEWMYRLGNFYAMTLRDQQAMKIYQELFNKWYWDKKRQIPRDDPYVGQALYQYGILRIRAGHDQQGIQKLQAFIKHWGDNAKVDPTLIQNAKRRIASSKFGQTTH